MEPGDAGRSTSPYLEDVGPSRATQPSKLTRKSSIDRLVTAVRQPLSQLREKSLRNREPEENTFSLLKKGSEHGFKKEDLHTLSSQVASLTGKDVEPIPTTTSATEGPTLSTPLQEDHTLTQSPLMVDPSPAPLLRRKSSSSRREFLQRTKNSIVDGAKRTAVASSNKAKELHETTKAKASDLMMKAKLAKEARDADKSIKKMESRGDRSDGLLATKIQADWEGYDPGEETQQKVHPFSNLLIVDERSCHEEYEPPSFLDDSTSDSTTVAEGNSSCASPLSLSSASSSFSISRSQSQESSIHHGRSLPTSLFEDLSLEPSASPKDSSKASKSLIEDQPAPSVSPESLDDLVDALSDFSTRPVQPAETRVQSERNQKAQDDDSTRQLRLQIAEMEERLRSEERQESSSRENGRQNIPAGFSQLKRRLSSSFSSKKKSVTAHADYTLAEDANGAFNAKAGGGPSKQNEDPLVQHYHEYTAEAQQKQERVQSGNTTFASLRGKASKSLLAVKAAALAKKQALEEERAIKKATAGEREL